MEETRKMQMENKEEKTQGAPQKGQAQGEIERPLLLQNGLI
jgi:hypothetical protein